MENIWASIVFLRHIKCPPTSLSYHFEAGSTEVLSSKSRAGKIIKNRKGEIPPRVNGEAEAMNPTLSSQSCTLFIRETTPLDGQKIHITSQL